jgi:nitrogen fixation protein NifX
MSTITPAAALRVGVASRVLELPPAEFSVRLAEQIGLPITEEKLAGVTVDAIKLILSGEETVETDIDPDRLKQAVRVLWGENGERDDAPEVEAWQEEDVTASLRVAVASNSAEQLDGHFGSCRRFLIYQVSMSEMRLVAVRDTTLADASEDKNAARAELLRDCQILYVQSIGGPAAAKVVRVGSHPIKMPKGGGARAILAQLQQSLNSPPPWLARIMGLTPPSLERFRAAAEAEDA